MNQEDIIRMALEAGLDYEQYDSIARVPVYTALPEELERFAALVAAAEREVILDEFWMSLQSDLEHGVKCLNEKAAADYQKNYPGLVDFAGWLNERGQA